MRRLTKFDALRAQRHLGINPEVISAERLLAGMLVELEHGTACGKRCNVTDDSILETARIALAHFKENPGSAALGIPDYYMCLDAMEKKSDEDWAGHEKPDPMIHS